MYLKAIKMTLLLRIFITLAILILFSTQTVSAEKPSVFVSILPQLHFLKAITGDRFDIQVMVQPGASPATYEPTPRQMITLSKSVAYFAIGVPFENAWLDKFATTNPKLSIIHTDAHIKKKMMGSHHHESHSGHDHQSDISGIPDPHIWLSPSLVKIQAANILKALKKIDPDHYPVYRENHNRFSESLDTLDATIRPMFSSVTHRSFMVFHPTWGYFAREYGLTQIPVEIEGKEPKPFQLKEIIEDARRLNIRIIFAQPQFSSRSATLIAREIHGNVIFIDPLAEEWDVNLIKAARQFSTSLKQKE